MQYILIILALFQSMFIGTWQTNPGDRRSASTNDELTNFLRVMSSLVLSTGEPRLRLVRLQRMELADRRHHHRHSDPEFWPPDRS